MWAGTFGGGVSCFSKNTWFTLRKSDGLNSNTIGAITADDSGRIILGGKNGLSIFTESNSSFKVNFNKILTPTAEMASPDISEIALSGIVGDRFYMTANPLVYNPSDSEIIDGMSRNLCRCGTYQKMFSAVKTAAKEG